jgi:hypothetical protein
MTISPSDLDHALQQLGETLVSWNWNSFGESALSTLAGAGVALGGLLYVFRRETAAQKEQRFISAVGGVFEAVSQHSKELKGTWVKGQNSYMMVHVVPDDFAVLSAVAKARFLSSRKGDSEVMDAVRELVLASRSLDLYARIAALTDIWPTLINWRSGGKSSEAVLRLQSNFEWFKKDIETYLDGDVWRNRRVATDTPFGTSGSMEEAAEFGSDEADKLGVKHVIAEDLSTDALQVTSPS